VRESKKCTHKAKNKDSRRHQGDEHKIDENAILEAKERMEQLYRVIPSAIFTVDAQGTITSFNKKAEEVTGYAAQEVLGEKCTIFAMNTCAGKCGLFAKDVPKPIMGKECVIKRKDGAERTLAKNADLIRDMNGNITGGVESFEDITERKKIEEILNYMAYYDTLTGLPNRMLFINRLDLAVSQAHRNREMLTVMFLDLDNFKTINDTLGHPVGDQLLQDVSERLESCLRKDDIIARIGGDEFTILSLRSGSISDGSEIAKKIMQALKPPFDLGGHEIHVTTSIGISVYPYNGKDSHTLLKNADAALYRAKELGRNNYQFYDTSMNAKAAEKLALENRVRKAFDNGEFVIYYQPQVDLISDGIVGMEALLRWNHPDFGTVYPAEFVPVLEEIGLLAEMDEWVLGTACKQNKMWQDMGLPCVRIAVNVSPKQFKRRDMVRIVDQVLAKTGLDPCYLDIEIIESVLIEDVEAIATIFYELREKGVRITIDDFATGYSSLSYLKKFPVDAVKIDQSFINDLIDSPDDMAIARAIITLAHNFGLRAVAEGVETTEQLEFLRTLNCDGAQGYIFSRPLMANDAAAILSRDIPLCA